MANTGKFNTTSYDGRYLTFSWVVAEQNIPNNSTTINWTLAGAGTASVGFYKAGNFKVTIDGKTVYASTTRINLYDGTVVKTGTYTFSHKTDGTKTFTASAEAGIYTVAVNCSGSATFTLPTIPRASTINSVSGNKITDKFVVKYKKAVSSYSDTLTIRVGKNSVAQKVEKYTSGSQISLSDALKSEIYAASTASQAATLNFQLITYSGNTKIGTSNIISKSVTVNDSHPEIGSVTYADTTSKTLAITGDSSQIIQNNSNVSVTVLDLKALNGATLVKLNVSIGSISIDTTLSGSSISEKVVNIGTIDLSTDSILTATVTDSRGNTAISSVNVSIFSYQPPTALIDCKRKDNYYTDTELTVNSVISSIGGNNAATIKAYYKKDGTTAYSDAVNVTDNATTTLPLDNLYAWNVKVTVADKLNTTTYLLFIEKGIPIIFFDRLKYSVGVNCFPKGQNSFEVSGKDIYNALFYRSGDSVAIKNVYASGIVTNTLTELDFSVTLPKSLEDIKTITILEMKLNVRHADGGFTLSSAYVNGGYDVLADSNITITYSINTGINAIAFYLDTKSKYNGTNNTPQTIQINSIKFVCN